MLQGPLDAARQALRSNPAVAVAAYAAVGFLGVTFLITLGRMALKYLDPKAKKQRNVNKNKVGHVVAVPGLAGVRCGRV